MVCGLIAGAVGALVVTKLAWRIRSGGCGGYYGHGGHCGGGARFMRRGGWGRHGRRGGRGMEFLLRELELNPRQREEVEHVIADVKDKIGGLDLGGLGANAAVVVDAFGDEAFDRAKLEAAATHKGEAIQEAKKAILDGLERVHDILIPEQRARLREMLARITGQRFRGPYDEASL